MNKNTTNDSTTDGPVTTSPGTPKGLSTVWPQPPGEELRLMRDVLLTTIPSLGLQWQVSFDFKPMNYDNSGWTNILHMTSGGDNQNPGDRIPGIFFKPDVGLDVETTIGLDKNSKFVIKPAPPVSKWSKVVVSQLLSGSLTMVSVKINEAAPLTRENSAPQQFSSVKVFASDPWHPAQAGTIRGLEIKTK